MTDRKSEAVEPVLVTDPREVAEREAANALRQTEWGLIEVERWIKLGKPELKASLLGRLHRLALDGLSQFAGLWRPDAVRIRGSSHEPVPGDEVAARVEEMLEYIEDNWDRKSPNHLAAYAMWRLNWIHPFSDGNGRTSRIFSYMILCEKIGHLMPGKNTIPEQISGNKIPYYKALEKADANYKMGAVDLSDLEQLLGDLLANQLVSVLGVADGKNFVAVASGDADAPSAPSTAQVEPRTTVLEDTKDFFERHPAKISIALAAMAILVTLLFA
jgi:fido (protein-threonine AMPylation protein)